MKSLESSLAVMSGLHNAFVRQASPTIFVDVLKDIVQCLSDRDDWAIGDDVAVSFHSRPRTTDDVDLIVASEDSIEDLIWELRTKFKQIRKHAVVHKQTGVEVELVTPDLVCPSEDEKDEFRSVFEAVLNSYIQSQDLRGITVPIIGKQGLIALKMLGSRFKDTADIVELLKDGDVTNDEMFELGLSDSRFKRLNDARGEAFGRVKKFVRD